MEDSKDLRENPEEKDEDYTFIREKIKERPLDRKKLFKKGIFTFLSAVLFGLIACLTFVILSPVFQRIFESEPENVPVQIVTFPEETIDEEMNPEDMLTDSDVMEELTREQSEHLQQFQDDAIEDILSQVTFSLSDYRKLYEELSDIAKEAEKSLVRIDPVSSENDMFLNIQEAPGNNSGLIVAEADERLFILARQKGIVASDSCLVTFNNGVRNTANVTARDDNTGLCILTVPLNDINEVTKKSIEIAGLGSSLSSNLPGSPVVAVGSPMGSFGSLNFGMVTSSNLPIYVTDATYKKIGTDIYGSTNASGVLINLNGEVIGIIDPAYAESDSRNLITAIGISELKRSIENMINGIEPPVVGINGTDVPKEVSELYNAPEGVFVMSVNMNSPAMVSGLQSGDIITSIGGVSISGMNSFTGAIRNMNHKADVKLTVYRMVSNEYRPMEITLTLE